MIHILPIASGSTGNCMLVDIDGRRVIIDLGVTAAAFLSALSRGGYTPADIDAVLITHTHSDHTKGLTVCMKRLSAPLFMSSTSKTVLMREDAAVLNYNVPTEILPGLTVTAFPTSHDCPGSVGFLMETASSRFGYATDLGVMTDGILDLLSGSDCIVIESNHDEEMLRYGRYPAVLKQRILSDNGHLSNRACSEAVSVLAGRGTRTFLLAHLSRDNNRPELALASARKAVEGLDADIAVLPPTGGSAYEIGQPESEGEADMKIRKAVPEDLDAVERIYDDLHLAEETGTMTIGWIRDVYPVRATAENALSRNDLFVLEQDGSVLGAAIINQIQVEDYYTAPWKHEVDPERICVLHTLVISPRAARMGLGQKFVRFYEEYAAAHRCPELRIDTNARNAAARAMYRKLGYTEIAIVPTVFNHIPDVSLVLLEKWLGTGLQG